MAANDGPDMAPQERDFLQNRNVELELTLIEQVITRDDRLFRECLRAARAYVLMVEAQVVNAQQQQQPGDQQAVNGDVDNVEHEGN